ncbi:MAG: hypothetical protein PHR25_03015 [Clostridia bacterium]|nr:hypothetical protein [Clostridia bacterium]
MYASIKKHNGFYVGRYEAGIADGMTKPTASTTSLANGQNIPRIKRGLYVWNYIAWGGTFSNTSSYEGGPGNDNSNGAVKAARSMYPDDSTNTTGVVSTLIYGVNWDAIMRWYKECGINVQDSTGMGNYAGGPGLKVTGSEETYQKKNIYDLAGNIEEWTMETKDIYTRAVRGGGCVSSSIDGAVSARHAYSPSLEHGTIGFRIIAYIK